MRLPLEVPDPVVQSCDDKSFLLDGANFEPDSTATVLNDGTTAMRYVSSTQLRVYLNSHVGPGSWIGVAVTSAGTHARFLVTIAAREYKAAWCRGVVKVAGRS